MTDTGSNTSSPTVRLCVLALAVTATACSSQSKDMSAEPPIDRETALVKGLPARCVAREPRPAATVAFVARGLAWALDPRTGRVTCLFAAREPGPFRWGPRGDRALLARLEVKGLARAPSRPPGTVDPPAASWGRPIGKSIVFVGHGGRALLKAHPGGGGFTDVTPVAGVRYERVVYHPSGLAFAFVLERGKHASVWLSSNRGESPRQLVHGRLHTAFGPIAFSQFGDVVYFAARHKDGHVDVHSLPISGADYAPVVWRGRPGEHVTNLFAGPGADVAFTVGRSCESSRAVAVTARRRGAIELLQGRRASRAVGWLDDGHVLVAAGGCGRKLDLYSVGSASRKARLLVGGVDTASVRRPERFPPPPFPEQVLHGRSSFA